MNQKRNYREEAKNSNFAWKIIRKIYLEEANYTKEIANQLDSQPQSVSNYLKGLRELGIIEKSDKVGRTQLYEINSESFYDVWVSLWCSKLDLENEEELISTFGKYFVEDLENEFRMNIRTFISNYAENFLEEYDASNISKALTKQLTNDLWLYIADNFDDVPEWLINFGSSLMLIQASRDESKLNIKEEIGEKIDLTPKDSDELSLDTPIS